MKILVITSLYPPTCVGGYEIGCSKVVNSLIQRGHQVRVLTSILRTPAFDLEVEEKHVFRVLGFQGYTGFALQQFSFESKAWPQLKQWRLADALLSQSVNTASLLDHLRHYSPDCVYFFDLRGIGGVGLISSLNELKYPWVIHFMDGYGLKSNGFGPESLKVFGAFQGEHYADGNIIAMSRRLVDEIEESDDFRFPTPPAIIPGWVDTITSRLVREYMPLGVVRFVSASRICEEKGIGILIEAASILRNSGLFNFSIDVYGEGEIGEFMQLVESSNLQDYVKFLGHASQSDLLDRFRDADVFLFPTMSREPFGFAPVEAASVGCVPIITAGCGVSEWMKDKIHSLHVERTASSLAMAMASVCTKETDLELLGINTHNLVFTELSLARCTIDIERVLNRAVQNRASAELPTQQDYLLDQRKYNLSREKIMSVFHVLSGEPSPGNCRPGFQPLRSTIASYRRRTKQILRRVVASVLHQIR